MHIFDRMMRESEKGHFNGDSRPPVMGWALAGPPIYAPSTPGFPPVDLMRAVSRKLRKCPVSHLAMAQTVSWAKQFACAIRSTGSSCRGRRALYAAGRRRIHIISSLCNLVHSETE